MALRVDTRAQSVRSVRAPGVRTRRGPATALLAVAGAAVAAPCCYLAVLSLAALRRPVPVTARSPLPRLTVLVPAHNEAELIGRCLHSLRAQQYPPELAQIVVIADNCADATAEIAMAGGAEVLTRHAEGERGKGPALRWAMDKLLASPAVPDAFVVVDADSVAGAGLLAGLAAALQGGAEAVQGEYLALEEEAGPTASLRSAAFLLFHRTRFRGRAVLGLPCFLVGNGMLLSRGLVERTPWTAFSPAEDLEYTVVLRLSGVRPVFAEAASLRAPVASTGAGARTQRLRWEGGRAHVVRTYLPALLRQALPGRRRGTWDVVVDLLVPPLGVLAAGLGAGGGLAGLAWATGLTRRSALVPWAVATVALPLHVLVGLYAADAPRNTYAALLQAPRLVLRDLATRSTLLRGLGSTSWERTARPGEHRQGPADSEDAL